METMPASSSNRMIRVPKFPQPTDDNVYEIPIYLPSGKSGCISIPKPLTNQEWEQVMAIINVYKPSIVTKITKVRSLTEDYDFKRIFAALKSFNKTADDLMTAASNANELEI